MELTVKIQTLFYAITGAIISYYFAHSPVENIKYSLLIPFFMSIGFTLLSAIGSYLIGYMRIETFNLRDKLGFEVAPDLGILRAYLAIFGIISLIIACGCLFLMVN